MTPPPRSFPLRPLADPVAGAVPESIDPVVRSAYVRRFEREIRSCPWRAADARRARQALADARLVLLGEYHALGSAAETARGLLRGWHAAGRECALGLEMVHARDQHALDDYLAGRIESAELRELIRYHEEWGYPWAAAGRLLETARRLGVPVHGLDVPPRGGVRDLALRDRVAAERVAALLDGGRRRVAVVFGEAHLAADHLPGAIASRLARVPRTVRVFHDVELGPGAARRGWLRAPGGLFARQRLPAGSRARALAATWRRWAADVPGHDDLDLPHLVHSLIEAQADALGVDLRRARAGPALRLADRLPTVFGPRESGRARRLLRRRGLTRAESERRLAEAAAAGALYDARANAILLRDPGLGPVALVAATWLGRVLARTDGAGARARDAATLALAFIVDPGLPPASLDGARAVLDDARRIARDYRERRLSPAALRQMLRG